MLSGDTPPPIGRDAAGGGAHATLSLEPNPAAPACARQFVRETFRSWGVLTAPATAELLVSELVTNVVRHARTPSTVEVIDAAGRLRIQVSDRSAIPLCTTTASPGQVAGWGLAIVDRLASRWGTEISSEGKTVWFEVDPRAGAT